MLVSRFAFVAALGVLPVRGAVWAEVPWISNSVLFLAGSLLLAGLIAVWGFGPLFRERRRVAEVIERSAGVSRWGLVSRLEADHSKRARARESRRFVVLTIATLALATAAISVHRVLDNEPVWLGAAIFYGGMIAWELLCSRKSWRNRLGHAGFWLLLFSTSFGADLLPNESVWKVTTPLIGVIALLLVAFRARDEKEPTKEHVIEAYQSGAYDAALTLAAHMDSERTDRTGEYRIRALIHYRRREFDEAEILLRKALSIQWEGRRASRLLVQLSNVLVERGEYEAAEKALSGAAEMDPRNSSVERAATTLLLRRNHDAGEALGLSLRALECDDREYAVVFALRAWALAENNRPLDALQSAEHAASLFEASNKPVRAEAAYYAGRALLRCGSIPEGETMFRKSAMAEPDGLFGWLSQQALRSASPIVPRVAETASVSSVQLVPVEIEPGWASEQGGLGQGPWEPASL